MTARLKNMSKGGQVALVAGALLLVVAVGWFGLIGPKRSTANSLKQQTAAVQAQIAANRSSAFTQALPAVRSASVFRLAMAMPTKLQTADIILQLNALAYDSGISFDRIAPNAASSSAVATTATTDPFLVEPIQVQFTGSFYNLVSFLQRVRNLVRVQGNRLYTAGRLFDVSQVSFSESKQGWPQITATLTLNAFVPQPPQAATPAAPGSTTSTTTTTGTTTTTSSGTSAAPSTSGGTS